MALLSASSISFASMTAQGKTKASPFLKPTSLSSKTFMGGSALKISEKYAAKCNGFQKTDICMHANASYKVVVVGTRYVGARIADYIKEFSLASPVIFYDIDPRPFPSDFGAHKLATSLKDAQIVVIAGGVRRRPDMTYDGYFDLNAKILKYVIEAVADNCPNAFVEVVMEPLNSLVPVAALILEERGVYDQKKLFGVVSTYNSKFASNLASKMKNTNVDVPVVGGQDVVVGQEGVTSLPLFSKAKPPVTFTVDDIREMTLLVMTIPDLIEKTRKTGGTLRFTSGPGLIFGTEVFLHNFYAESAVAFLKSSLKALDGDSDVYETAYVQSDLYDGVPFFATRVRISKHGIAEVVSSDLDNLSYFEKGLMEAVIKPCLKYDIEKATRFIRGLQ